MGCGEVACGRPGALEERPLAGGIPILLTNHPVPAADKCKDVVCNTPASCQKPDGKCNKDDGSCLYEQADPGTPCTSPGLPEGSTCDAAGNCQAPGEAFVPFHVQFLPGNLLLGSRVLVEGQFLRAGGSLMCFSVWHECV